MSYRELQPLPPDVAALLAAERRAPRPPAAREEAIRARREAALGAAVITAAAAGAAQASGRTATVTGGAATAKGLAAALPASKALLATIALVTGGVGAAAGTYLALHHASHAPALASPAQLPVEPQAGRAASRDVPTGAPSRQPPVVAPSARQTAPAAAERAARAGDDLMAESALLEHARRALDRGAPALAVADLKRHARLFARGHLIEEREALWVKALATSGQAEAARSRAASFQRRFPHSIQQEAVDRALREIP